MGGVAAPPHRAIAALSIGGMVVARTMVDRALADELRTACMSVALDLGGWDKMRKSKDGKSKQPQRLRAAALWKLDALKMHQIGEESLTMPASFRPGISLLAAVLLLSLPPLLSTVPCPNKPCVKPISSASVVTKKPPSF